MKLTARAAALALTAALLLPTATALEETPAAPLTPAQKQEDLDFLYDTLKAEHPGLFTHTTEADFLARKAEIEAGLEKTDDFTFAMEAQSLTALAGDSHTTVSLGSQTRDQRFFPFSAMWFEGIWYLAAISSSQGDFVGRIITAINGILMDQVVERFSWLVSADNPVKLRRQAGQLLYVADILEYLDLAQPGEPLTLTLQDTAGSTADVSLEALSYEAFQTLSPASINDLRSGTPATAFDRSKYYFSLPLDENTYYIQYNRCQEDPDLPMDRFAAQAAAELEAGNYGQVILDLRNNGGGSDGVLHPLLSALTPSVRDGSLRLWGLVGETTYSSAVINAVMITEMGGYLAGSPSSGSVDHFGSVASFSLPNSGLRVGCSSKWIDLSTLFETALDYGVDPLRPDVPTAPTLEDYLAGRDTEVEYLLAHGLEFQPPDTSDRPLTRGRLLTFLYEAAGAEPTAPDAPFADAVPFAYHAPAVNWASELGIAPGGGEGTLSPARPITRAEAALFLTRCANLLGLSLDGEAGGFSDQALIPAWAQDAARRASALGMTADVSGAFHPGGPMTQAEGKVLAAALFR